MKKKNTKIVRLAFGGIILLVSIIVAAISFITMNNIMNSDVYAVDNESIPSIKAVVGKRAISKVLNTVENGVTTHTIIYKPYESTETMLEDLRAYVNYLQENDFTLLSEMDSIINEHSFKLIKGSLNSDGIIAITINFELTEYEIMIQKLDMK